MDALLIEQRALGGSLRWATLAAQGLATAQPGQFVMIHCGDPAGSDPALRQPFFIAGADARAGTIGLLYSETDAGGWLGRAAPGTVIDLLGPLGHPLAQPRPAAHALLVADGTAVAPLLFLAQRSQSAMLLVHKGPGAHSVLPPFLLPPDVEYLTSDGPLDALLTQRQGAGGEPPLTWCDTLVGAGSRELASSVGTAIRATRVRWPAGFAQFILMRDLPCGVGLCGGCAFTAGRNAERRLQCTDGPAVDWRDLL